MVTVFFHTMRYNVTREHIFISIFNCCSHVSYWIFQGCLISWYYFCVRNIFTWRCRPPKWICIAILAKSVILLSYKLPHPSSSTEHLSFRHPCCNTIQHKAILQKPIYTLFICNSRVHEMNFYPLKMLM